MPTKRKPAKAKAKATDKVTTAPVVETPEATATVFTTKSSRSGVLVSAVRELAGKIAKDSGHAYVLLNGVFYRFSYRKPPVKTVVTKIENPYILGAVRRLATAHPELGINIP